MLQRHEPFIGEAEGPRSLIGVIVPAQFFLADALVEPDGFLRLRILRDLYVKLVPQGSDIVLEDGVAEANADDQYPDNNLCNRLATHGRPFSKPR